MNYLLIHDLTAAIERDAEDLSSNDHDAPFTGSWSGRADASAEHEDEYLERILARLRMGPPSMRS